ncbi:hypothetical protein EVA_08832 [gut metagenome]|uniref:Uncharacterized protein n=1 Tax=gut metagenome TaxID=749906 RepID=J9G8A5_9ZZZZ
MISALVVWIMCWLPVRMSTSLSLIPRFTPTLVDRLPRPARLVRLLSLQLPARQSAKRACLKSP